MATNPPGDLVLTPLHGDPRPLDDWLTTFHLASVVLDPFTNESAWILDTAARILRGFQGAAVRANFLLTCTADEAVQFLGPLAKEILVFCDPDRAAVKALGLKTLPAFVFLRIDRTVAAVAEGWNALEWRAVAKEVATTTQWSAPAIPVDGDPVSYAGTPALA
jgi:hypothetical protein